MGSNALSSKCSHSSLLFTTSTHAKSTKYTQPTRQQLLAAETTRGTVKSLSTIQAPSPSTFPAPLIFPNDDLALDPTCPPQSLRSWICGKYRNEVTPKRRTLYVPAPPEIEDYVSFVEEWTKPRGEKRKSELGEVDMKAVVEYLEAFYFGLPVKLLPEMNMAFTKWTGEDGLGPKSKRIKAKAIEENLIGLKSPSPSGPICTKIRTRPTPKGDFTDQLNLDDLLNAAISALPEDAYALVMLVDHDLYEDDDDEFVCGRASGGSRVAMISVVRYNPALDEKQEVIRNHAWPASHCREYVRNCSKKGVEPVVKPKKGVARRKKDEKEKEKEIIVIDSSSDEEERCASAMEAALLAHRSLPSLESLPSVAALAGLWLGRVCRTTAHELGHCFGIAHCTYYACSMQGSASIIEDARQPPYLCPVDLAKVLRATEGNMVERYEALQSFCDRHRDTHLFSAYGAWIRGRLKEFRI